MGKVCVGIVYDSTSGNDEESEWFWSNLDCGLDRVGNRDYV